MNASRPILRRLWKELASVYDELVWEVLTGDISTARWAALRHLFEAYLGWTDLAAASGLRYRATRRRTALPESGIEIPQGPYYSIDVALGEIASTNLWYAQHRASSLPLIQARAEWLAATEQRFWEDRRDRILHLLHRPAFAESFDPLARLDMRRRDAHNEIAHTAEQIQLAHPDIGGHFPWVSYQTREDARVRPSHAAMLGFVALRSWRGWPFAVPPCSWNCRCFLIFHTLREAIAKGWAHRDGSPRWELRWPNDLARRNWEAGAFPEWKTPRYWAFPPGSGRAVA